METVKTMTDQRDIYRLAKLLIGRYGYDDAKLHAAELADAMLERGDMDGRRKWHRISSAANELGDTIPIGVIH
jgi:hypothetical protein